MVTKSEIMPNNYISEDSARAELWHAGWTVHIQSKCSVLKPAEREREREGTWKASPCNKVFQNTFLFSLSRPKNKHKNVHMGKLDFFLASSTMLMPF